MFRTVRILVLLLFLVLTLLYAGLLTPSGLKGAVWTAQKLLPELNIKSAEGALLTGITLRGVHYQQPSVVLDAERFELALSPKCFRDGELCLKTLDVKGLQLELSPPPDGSQPKEEADNQDVPANKFRIPVPVTVQSLNLDDISLNVAGKRVAWQHFQSAASFKGSELVIAPTVFSSLSVSLPKKEPSSNTQQTSNKAPTKAHVDRAVEAPTIVLPEVQFPFDIDLQKLTVNGLSLMLPDARQLKSVILKAQFKNDEIRVSTLNVNAAEGSADLTGKVRLYGNYPLDLSLNADIKQAPLANQQLTVQVKGAVDALNLSAGVTGTQSFTLNGTLNAIDSQLPFTLNLTANNLQWPLSGKPLYQVSDTRVDGKGSLAGYHFSLNGRTRSEYYPPMSLQTEAEGDLEHLALTQLSVDTLRGHAEGEAGVQWGQKVRWQADLNANDIQPGEFWPDLEGKLSGHLVHDGGVTNAGGWFVNFPTMKVNGELRSLPFLVEGQLSLEDRQATGELKTSSDDLTISHGPNNVTLNGVLDDKWDLKLALDAPELSASLPDLQGKLVGSAVLTGNFQQPELSLDIEAKRLKWQDLGLEALSLKGQVKSTDIISGELAVKGQKFTQGDVAINTVDLRLTGDETNHTAKLTFNGKPVAGDLSLSGGFNRKAGWRGALTQGDIVTPLGKWVLADKAAISLGLPVNSIDVSSHCWRQGASALCLTDNAKIAEKGNVQLSASTFSLEQLTPFLPPHMSVEGNLDGTANVEWGSSLLVSARVNLPRGEFTQQKPVMRTIGWDSIQLVATMNNETLTSEADIALTDNGKVRAQLAVNDLASDNKRLTGELEADSISLHPLASFVGEDAVVKGNLNSRIAITGTMKKPLLTGDIAMLGLKLDSAALPVTLNDGRLNLRLLGDQAELDGQLNTPEGKVGVDGKADWRQSANWQGFVNLDAETLDVSVPPMVRLKAAPRLTVSINKDTVMAKGEVNVPWARIVVDSLPETAIRVSDDQVLLDENLEPIPQEKSAATSVNADILVKLGDDVTVDAFGLKSFLNGELRVRNSERGPGVVGEVSLREGTYRSFGQDLVIRKGVIRFNGVPDQPYLQVVAIRNPETIEDDVTAGIKLNGPADEPQVTLFSDPAKAQANVLSYLTQGRDLDAESSGTSFNSLLLGLALSQSGKMVGKIGEAFGVENLTLDSKSNGDSENIEVSGYVLPGLQVKYGLGVEELTIRYRIMKDLYLEAMSGLEKTFDLLYQFSIR
ncbi:hypothetical protein A8L45_03825 [Veronia pacifica]|uniref:Translocation and assembly module TamB C-terminal domain-containing protein n=1 Tax=Veronia pacifica TaxID=1080227 RepID=A0A1C3EQ70_9GAMM|nr:hypothetical protein A8L45_03825 [Veronia pacifica]